MFKMYVLYSKTKERFYIGQTKDLEDRITRHNGGRVKSTKFGAPWIIIHAEEYKTRKEAVQREQFLKSPEGWLTLKEIKENFFRNVAQPG